MSNLSKNQLKSIKHTMKLHGRLTAIREIRRSLRSLHGKTLDEFSRASHLVDVWS